MLIDTVKAKGKKELPESCPYGAIYWNEEADVAQKCTMCAHILDGDEKIKMPRCAHSCPTDAITFYHLEPEDMEKKVQQETLEVYHPERGTKPNVYYKNLYRYEKAFVTGGILKDNECAEGVTVTLNGNNEESAQITDCFGEFKFDALEPGAYALVVNGNEVQKVNVELSVNVGTIEI